MLRQDPIRRSSLMLSRDSDGARFDSILDGGELASDQLLVTGDDDGGTPTPLPVGEAVAEEEGTLSPWADDDDDGGGGKESSGEQGSGGDVECPECGKFFRNDKSMFGHLRSHPKRGYKGASPPEKKPNLSPRTEGSSGQCSGRDPQLTPFELFCACIMYTLRSRDIDNHQAEQQALPQPPPLAEARQIEAGIGLTAGNVAGQVKIEDPGPEIRNPLLCDERGGSMVKIPKKRRRSATNKEDREASKKVRFTPATTKEKRPYVCKHCKAEFSTHQALGGHMAGHHREKKATLALMNKEETSSQARQGGAAGQRKKGKQLAKGGADESCRAAGLSLSSRRLQVEQLSVGWLSRQAPGGHRKLHFVRRNDGAPPAAVPGAADGGQRKPLNIDLNVEAPEQHD